MLLSGGFCGSVLVELDRFLVQVRAKHHNFMRKMSSFGTSCQKSPAKWYEMWSYVIYVRFPLIIYGSWLQVIYQNVPIMTSSFGEVNRVGSGFLFKCHALIGSFYFDATLLELQRNN